MSHYDYEVSKRITAEDYPFYALVMALYRQADSDNQHLIQNAWPEVVHELRQRYNAPGGFLPHELEDLKSEPNYVHGYWEVGDY